MIHHDGPSVDLVRIKIESFPLPHGFILGWSVRRNLQFTINPWEARWWDPRNTASSSPAQMHLQASLESPIKKLLDYIGITGDYKPTP